MLTIKSKRHITHWQIGKLSPTKHNIWQNHARQDIKQLTFFFPPDWIIASAERGDMFSKADGVIGEEVFREGCNRLSSWRGTTTPFSAKLSNEKRLLPLALVLLLWSALSPISPASETASLSMESSSNCRGKENDMLKECLREELAPLNRPNEQLRLDSNSRFWWSIILFLFYWDLETSAVKIENFHVNWLYSKL